MIASRPRPFGRCSVASQREMAQPLAVFGAVAGDTPVADRADPGVD
jgi:hypothetical protein